MRSQYPAPSENPQRAERPRVTMAVERISESNVFGEIPSSTSLRCSALRSMIHWLRASNPGMRRELSSSSA